MTGKTENLTRIYLREWDSLSLHIASSNKPVEIDGKSLDLACILAVSRFIVLDILS